MKAKPIHTGMVIFGLITELFIFFKGEFIHEQRVYSQMLYHLKVTLQFSK